MQGDCCSQNSLPGLAIAGRAAFPPGAGNDAGCPAGSGHRFENSGKMSSALTPFAISPLIRVSANELTPLIHQSPIEEEHAGAFEAWSADMDRPERHGQLLLSEFYERAEISWKS